MVARVVRIENKKLPMKDATKGMQVIGLGDGAVMPPGPFFCMAAAVPQD